MRARNKFAFSSSPRRARNDITDAEPQPPPSQIEFGILIVDDDQNQKVQQNTASTSMNASVKQSQEAPPVQSAASIPATTEASDNSMAVALANRKQKLADEKEKTGASKRVEAMLKSIRHMNVLFWIIVFANLSLIFPYGMILWRVSKAGNGTYALHKTWDFLVPSIIVEVVVALFAFPYFAWLRLSDIKSRAKKFSLHLLLGAHITHFLVVLIVISIITKLRISGVRHDFEKDLNTSMLSGNRSKNATIKIVEILDRTQLQKKCCGINSYKDWKKLYPNENYPSSCCNDPLNDKVCSKKEVISSNRDSGCLAIEISAMLSLSITFITSLVLSAILSVLMVLQLMKIERYIRTNCSGVSEISGSATALNSSKSHPSQPTSKASMMSGNNNPNENAPKSDPLANEIKHG